MSLTTIILGVTISILGALWLWIQYHYSYWKRHNVPFIKPNFIFGNFKDLATFKMDPCTFFQKLYNHKVAKNQPFVGLHLFNKPCLLVRDLDLAKTVLIKDFNKFSNRHTASDPHSDSLGADNLFFIKNPKWKEIRVKVTPVFTSGKMKQMFPLVEEIGRELDEYLSSLPLDPKTNSVMVEVKNISSCFATDVIATVAYGVQANSLADPNNEFRRNGKRIFEFTPLRAIQLTSFFLLPSLAKLFRFKVFSDETTKFIRDTINYVMDERVKSGIMRNDLIDILLKFRQEAEAEKENKHFVLEGDCLVAQAAIFFSAGFETSSATISFCLYELSRHQHLQERLREEIREALKSNDGKITYEMLTELKFLNNVVLEVLRFYPPLPFLDRECTLSQDDDGYSLQPFSEFVVPNGMPVFIPAHALHMDSNYFPDPEAFDPDRFAPENRHRANLSAYMPFGIGPHNCIGERLGLMQTKVGLINFLRNHYVTPCEKSHNIMKLEPRAIVIQSQGGVYCNVVRDPLI